MTNSVNNRYHNIVILEKLLTQHDKVHVNHILIVDLRSCFIEKSYSKCQYLKKYADLKYRGMWN